MALRLFNAKLKWNRLLCWTAAAAAPPQNTILSCWPDVYWTHKLLMRWHFNNNEHEGTFNTLQVLWRKNDIYQWSDQLPVLHTGRLKLLIFFLVVIITFKSGTHCYHYPPSRWATLLHRFLFILHYMYKINSICVLLASVQSNAQGDSVVRQYQRY